ncbi:MAG: aminoglycoside phosphotransferase family protein [Acidimicrobiales bacterium]
MPEPAAEIDVTPDLVGELLRQQHPDLASLPLRREARGWDNDIYRLGDDLSVRLPRRLAGAVLILHEQRWLPVVAPALPLPVPVPLRTGVPGAGFPWAWSICAWLPGAEIEEAPPDDWEDAARVLGGFLAAVHRSAPPEAPHNPYRGVPLEDRAAIFAAGLDLLAADVDRAPLMAAWHRALGARVWDRPAVWLHGDVHPRNVLVDGGEISAVIDFGDMTAGDPASDLAVAWMLFPPETRAQFRAACGGAAPVDDATWERARGWALVLGVAMSNGDDRIAAIGRRTLAAVVADR